MLNFQNIRLFDVDFGVFNSKWYGIGASWSCVER